MRNEPVSIERRDPVSLGDVLPKMLRVMRMSKGMNEHLILSAWDKVTGAGAYTMNKYLKNGVLYCDISSSMVRNQLFFNKEAIIEAINNEVLGDPLFTSKAGERPLKTLVLK